MPLSRITVATGSRGVRRPFERILAQIRPRTISDTPRGPLAKIGPYQYARADTLPSGEELRRIRAARFLTCASRYRTWPGATEDDAIGSMLYDIGIDSIDVALGKYFADILSVDRETVGGQSAESGSGRRIEIIGLQALLHGVSRLEPVRPARVQEQMLNWLRAVCCDRGRTGATPAGVRFARQPRPRNSVRARGTRDAIVS